MILKYKTTFSDTLKPLPWLVCFIIGTQPHYNRAQYSISVDPLNLSGWTYRRVPESMYPTRQWGSRGAVQFTLTFPPLFVLSSLLVWGVLSLTWVPEALTEMSLSLGSNQAWDRVRTSAQAWREDQVSGQRLIECCTVDYLTQSCLANWHNYQLVLDNDFHVHQYPTSFTP
jgi:hypothetical protein